MSMGWPCHWTGVLKVTRGKDLSLKGWVEGHEGKGFVTERVGWRSRGEGICHSKGGLKVTRGSDLSLKGWVEGHEGKGLVTERVGWRSRGEGICHSKGGLRVLSVCLLVYTDKQFAFCEPFQKNLWESVNCSCSIKVSVESYVIL
jgi:hypothetical protein